ncbi:heparinase II III family protein [Coniophora puteana RWD-64-598 SS2]|uniref:Heparinase II III family protein n=1 Tax=Coniophora puteana (strain RWD-64-598) TaxID=741705 RepID=R7SF26_CONPW|nr:heparinase II III family protein [Coniophora puteana RWD-64-598 SS2]EIW74347.1 heparinase II III family protein [Coniophora puteana RWD-64-598 SS2]
MAANYSNVNNASSPYGSGDPYYSQSTGYITPQTPPKKKTSGWIKFGVPVALIIIVAAVLGGVFGSRASKNSTSASSAAAAASASSVKKEIGIFATGTDSLYGLPIYPSTTNSAAFSSPTFISTQDSTLAWPQDSFKPSSPSITNLRPDRPRLIAPSYKWAALPTLIANDPYMSYWNQTIFMNATIWYNADPVPYILDGGNGILDPARQVKQRIKAFSYCYRVSNDTKWLDRTWVELQNAAGNLTGGWGPNNSTKWNPVHFLDTAEMTAAYAIGYDWLYDVWSDTQKQAIMWSMITYGLNNGAIAYSDHDTSYYGWWTKGTQGNWNCVCNGGLTMGALAILNDDPTGVAQALLQQTIPSALGNCILATSSDGTWSETPDYWYFGTTGLAELAASVQSATGSDLGLLSTNANLHLGALYHMYVTGPGSLFNWGDNGVNKYTATANAVMFYGQAFDKPAYQLFQRDALDAADPWNMFWYNPTVSGAFWDGLALDHYFDNSTDQWASMRSSWADENALFVGAKAGTLQGHQSHNDLDCGDFVVDALGARWFGELGDENYLVPGYFSNDDQDSQRWLYYRKRTEGQNVVLVGGANQNVKAAPTVKFDSSNTVQGATTVADVSSDSTAYFVSDLTSAYFNVTSMKRGIRMINARKQVLVQDEINSQAPVQWRAHTNATVSLSNNNQTATLTIGDATMVVELVNPPSGAAFSTVAATRLPTDPTLPAGGEDLPNDTVTVLAVSLPAGQYTLQVLMTPQWPGLSQGSLKSPGSVALDQWSLSSHP